MVDEMKKLREHIHANIAELREFKNKNYHELYNNGDLRYIDEITRGFCISSANVATFIDHLESQRRYATLDLTEQKKDESDSLTNNQN